MGRLALTYPSTALSHIQSRFQTTLHIHYPHHLIGKLFLKIFLLGLFVCLIPYASLFSQNLGATGQLKVLAVMVEFQPDTTEFTSGNGTFDEGSLLYMENEDIRIDPLPHNPTYFEAHLEFVKNWYGRVSNNQLEIDYHLLPNIYRLDREMATYSPTGENFDFRLLAEFARDVWTKVDEGPELNLPWQVDGQTALVIFHAGVGRDIELIGTILDKTFQDIPSITLSEQTLERYSDVLDPSTFRIKGGQIPITNSLIIPRTLTRRGEIFEEEQIISFSINGLLTASIGSFIGIPDLFNTENGRSGIGRFGLMDAGGFILNYNGLFPPYPSAWERVYLGWEQPEVINGKEGELIQLPAASLHQGSSIARYNITRDEYYLIENRHRDTRANGVTLTYQLPDGSRRSQSFTNADTTFANQLPDFDSLLVKGVLVDVDNPDFSLPGGLDVGEDRRFGTDDDRELNGGLLIWHVDDAVIRARPNGVNANEDRRGIDLEEADGAQDIGKPIEGSLVDLSSGHAFDFWWSGNNYRVLNQLDTLFVYQNRFGADTRPAALNNAGGFTGFELFDISDNLPIASFRIRNDSDPFFTDKDEVNPVSNVGKNLAQPLSTLPSSFKQLDVNGRTYVTKFTNQRVEIFDASDPSVQFSFLNETAIRDIYLIEVSGNPLPEVILYTAEEDEWTIKRLQVDFNNNWLELWSRSYSNSSIAAPIRSFIQSSNFLVDQFGEYRIHLEDGDVEKSEVSGVLNLRASDGQQVSLLLDLSMETGTTFITFNGSGFDYNRILGLGLAGSTTSLRPVVHSDNRVYFFDENGNLLKSVLLQVGTYPAIADINKDGSLDVIVADERENSVSAYDANGSVINGFPISLNAFGLQLEGGIKVIKNSTTEESIFLFEARDAISRFLVAINAQTGRMLPSFPRSLGAIEGLTYSNSILLESQRALVYQSTQGNINLSYFSDEYEVLWKGIYGNNPDNFFEASATGDGSDNVSTELLVEEETYNWPNPAKDFTNLRLQSIDGARIDLLVSRPSGQIIYRDSFDYSGDLPFEYELDTGNWPSGVYLARVQASKDGSSKRKIVKIAVVK